MLSVYIIEGKTRIRITHLTCHLHTAKCNLRIAVHLQASISAKETETTCTRRTSAIPVPIRMILCKGSTSFAHLSRAPIFDTTTFVISTRLESTKGFAEKENATVARGGGSLSCSELGLRLIAVHFKFIQGH